jgi:hypothetical protein
LSIVSAKGSVHVELTNMTLSLSISVKSQKVNGVLVPAFTSSNVKVVMPDGVSLCVYSNVIAPLADSINKMFANSVKPMLVQHL